MRQGLSMQRIFQTILDWWLAKEGFEMGFLKLSQPMIAATMDIYKESMANLLPTPSKSPSTCATLCAWCRAC